MRALLIILSSLLLFSCVSTDVVKSDISSIENKQERALFKAVADENDAQVKKLITRGVNVNAKDNDGLTPIFYAAKFNKNAKIMQLLTNAGADVNIKNKEFMSSLHYAAGYNKDPENVITSLVNAGANINSRSEDYSTPLISAWNNPKAIKTLIALGADVNAQDKWGDTAYGLADGIRSFGVDTNSESVALLRAAGGGNYGNQNNSNDGLLTALQTTTAILSTYANIKAIKNGGSYTPPAYNSSYGNNSYGSNSGYSGNTGNFESACSYEIAQTRKEASLIPDDLDTSTALKGSCKLLKTYNVLIKYAQLCLANGKLTTDGINHVNQSIFDTNNEIKKIKHNIREINPGYCGVY